MSQSIAEFLAMGGYGEYVWSAYGIVTIVMAILLVYAIARFIYIRNRVNNASNPSSPHH